MACLRLDFPASSPELKTFPSGGFLLLVKVSGEPWVLEHMPSLRAFGVSKAKKADFAWEGFDHGFSSLEEAEGFLLKLLAK